MIDDKNKTEIIEQYLQGTLHQDLADEFNQKLSTDHNFRHEVELQRSIIKAAILVGRGEMKQTFKQIHTEMASEDIIPPKTSLENQREHVVNPSRGIRVPRRVYAVAASLILLVLVVFYSKLSTQQVFNDQFQAYKTWVLRTEDNTSDIVTSYESSDYVEVTKQFEAQTNSSIKETFIAGISYLKLSQFDNAIKCFEDVMNSNISLPPPKKRFEDDAAYYLALSYLRTSHIKEAEAIFKKIHADPSHPYNEKVTIFLLIKIKVLKMKTRS